MLLVSSPGSNSYAQLITVLIIFVAVLAVTAYVTRWIANYQKAQGVGRNIEVVESARLSNNKWIAIVRVGHTYKAVVLSRDQSTYLGDIPAEELELSAPSTGVSFSGLFEKAMGKAKTAKNNNLSSADGNSDKDDDSCGYGS